MPSRNRSTAKKKIEIIINADPDFLGKLNLKENERIKRVFYKDILTDVKKDTNKGDYIKRKPYPEKYYKNHGVDNLFTYDVGNTHRIIYTIRTEEIRRLYQFLDLLTHKEYDVQFGYSTS